MIGSNTNTNCRVHISRQQLLELRYEKPQSIASQKQRQDSRLTGEVLSTVKGYGIEFTDIRPYQPGDEVRHIDWRTTARTGSPYTREYHEERQQTVYLAVDQRINMFFGSDTEFKSFSSARLAGIIAWAAVKHGFRLGGTIAETKAREDNYTRHHYTSLHPSPHTSSIRTGPSKRTALAFINQLALANNALSVNSPVDFEESASLDKLLTTTLAHRPSGSTVYVISDFHGFNRNIAKSLIAIGQKSNVVMIRVSDRLEEQLPPTATVGISNGLHHRVVRLTRNKSNDYLLKQREFLTGLQRCADTIGATLLHQLTTPAASHSDSRSRLVNQSD